MQNNPKYLSSSFRYPADEAIPLCNSMDEQYKVRLMEDIEVVNKESIAITLVLLDRTSAWMRIGEDSRS